MAVNESLFPDLLRMGYQITSPPDPIYNCIAHALGVTDNWWWPDPDGFDYWPPGVTRERTLTAFIQAFATAGHSPCPDGSLEPGWEKVAIYATDEGPAHAARRLDNGRRKKGVSSFFLTRPARKNELTPFSPRRLRRLSP